jgi:hypothetical protein
MLLLALEAIDHASCPNRDLLGRTKYNTQGFGWAAELLDHGLHDLSICLPHKQLNK